MGGSDNFYRVSVAFQGIARGFQSISGTLLSVSGGFWLQDVLGISAGFQKVLERYNGVPEYFGCASWSFKGFQGHYECLRRFQWRSMGELSCSKVLQEHFNE